MNDWPAVWVTHPLGQLSIKVGSGSTPRGGQGAYSTQGIPLIRSMNVVFFGFKREGLAYIDEAQAEALNNVTVEAGDVLLNITGASIGRVTLAPADMQGARVNQHVCIIRPGPCLDARFLRAYLSSPAMQSQIWEDNYGVTRQALTKQQILSFEVPVPPLPEQQRIADKLDTLLARVDAVNARLARVGPLLKRFRQAVLAAATSGRLTEDCRNGEDPQWKTETFEAIVAASNTGLVRSSAEQFHMCEELVPYLKMNSLGEMWGYQCSDLPGVHCTADELKRFELKSDDWLFNTRNSVELVGKSCVWRGPPGIVFNNNLLRVRFMPDVDPNWIEVFFRSPKGRGLLSAVKSATTSVAAIYQRSLMGLSVDIPPRQEQTEIVRRVDLLFAYADRLEARLQAAQTATGRLTPALLAKAFRGELVPQDPDDEPAAELLKRLRDAPAAASTRRRGARAAV